MTTTSEYLNEFTPDWPHGHVVIYKNGTTKPFITLTSKDPGDFPIWGHPIGDTFPWRFHADGTSGHAYYLRNVAPPRPKPREWWVNIYQGGTPGVAYATREIADDRRRENRLECIRVREVLDGEDTK